MANPHHKYKSTSFDKDLALVTNVLKEQDVKMENAIIQAFP